MTHFQYPPPLPKHDLSNATDYNSDCHTDLISRHKVMKALCKFTNNRDQTEGYHRNRWQTNAMENPAVILLIKLLTLSTMVYNSAESYVWIKRKICNWVPNTASIHQDLFNYIIDHLIDAVCHHFPGISLVNWNLTDLDCTNDTRLFYWRGIQCVQWVGDKAWAAYQQVKDQAVT